MRGVAKQRTERERGSGSPSHLFQERLLLTVVDPSTDSDDRLGRPTRTTDSNDRLGWPTRTGLTVVDPLPRTPIHDESAELSRGPHLPPPAAGCYVRPSDSSLRNDTQ